MVCLLNRDTVHLCHNRGMVLPYHNRGMVLPYHNKDMVLPYHNRDMEPNPSVRAHTVLPHLDSRPMVRHPHSLGTDDLMAVVDMT